MLLLAQVTCTHYFRKKVISEYCTNPVLKIRHWKCKTRMNSVSRNKFCCWQNKTAWKDHVGLRSLQGWCAPDLVTLLEKRREEVSFNSRNDLAPNHLLLFLELLKEVEFPISRNKMKNFILVSSYCWSLIKISVLHTGHRHYAFGKMKVTITLLFP